MNEDNFLKKKPMKPSAQFTQDLLDQLHELDEQEQNMSVYIPTLNNPPHTHTKHANKSGVILGLVASIAILFFGVQWLNSNNNYSTPTSEPLQIAPPQPEFVQRIGEYGAYVTSAIDDETNSATIITTTGVFRLSLDDFTAEPQRIRTFTTPSTYVTSNGLYHLNQGDTMIAARGDGTIEAFNIKTGETVSTWHYDDVPHEIKYHSFFYHQLTENGTRYHAPICVDMDCNQKFIATWDTTTGELLRTIEVTNASHIMTFTEDGQLLFYANDNQIIRHDVATGKETTFITVPNPIIVSIAVSPDNALIAVFSKRDIAQELHLYDINQPDEAIYDHKTVSHEDQIQINRTQRIVFSDDGQYLLALGLGQMNYRLDIAEKQVTYINLSEIFFIADVIPNPSQTHALRFRSSNQFELRTLDHPARTVGTSRYFFDNTHMLSFQALDDGVIWMTQGRDNPKNWYWRWTDEGLVAVEENLPPTTRHNGITYSTDKRYLAFIDANVNLHIYDRENQEIVLKTFIGQTNRQPHEISFDEDNRLYTFYSDGTIHIYTPDEGLVDMLERAETLSLWEPLAPDKSAFATFKTMDEYGNTPYSWEITFLADDELEIIGRVHITNQVLASPLALPTITFSPDGQSVLFGSHCAPDAHCPDMRFDNNLPEESYVYALSLTEFRQQLESMTDVPVEERLIEHTIEEAFDYTFDSVRQIGYRPNSDQIAVQTEDEIEILRLNGSELELLYTIPSNSIFSMKYFVFSPDGAIIYINSDGFFEAWRLPEVK